MKKSLLVIIALTLIVYSSFVANAETKVEGAATISMKIDGVVVSPTVEQKLISVSTVNNETVEVYEAEVSINFYENANGELVTSKARSSINEDASMLASAVKWEGSITYTKSTINGFTCYMPTKYSHKLTVKDSNFVITSLNTHGGACGYGFDTSNGNLKNYYTTRDLPMSKTNPTSGATYSKSMTQKYAFIKESSTSINSYGTFTYYRVSETGQPKRTSSEFEVSLL